MEVTEIVAHFLLQSLDFGQKSGSRCKVTCPVWLRLAQASSLALAPGNTFQRRLKLLAVGNHDRDFTRADYLRQFSAPGYLRDQRGRYRLTSGIRSKCGSDE